MKGPLRNLKTAIIYHAYESKEGGYTDCPDGVISAAIAANAIETEDWTPIPDSYKKNEYYDDPANNHLLKLADAGFESVYILDFSYPREWLEELEKRGLHVQVIDHHIDKTKTFDLANFSGALFPKTEEEDCGATLTWKYFYPDDTLPSVLFHVRNRDIGLHGYYEGEAFESEAVNCGLDLIRHKLTNSTFYPIGEKIRLSAIYEFVTAPWAESFLYTIGEPELIERNRVVDEFLKEHFPSKCHLVELNGEEFPLVRLTEEVKRFYSIVTHRMLMLAREEFGESVRLAACLHSHGGLSLRSDGFDVRRLAKLLGGGGHSKSSGVPYTPAVKELLEKFNIDCSMFN